MILYVPFFTKLFAITSLTWAEWQGVLWISLPIIFIDEALKWFSRNVVEKANKPVDVEPLPIRSTSTKRASKSPSSVAEDDDSNAPSTPRRRRSVASRKKTA